MLGSESLVRPPTSFVDHLLPHRLSRSSPTSLCPASDSSLSAHNPYPPAFNQSNLVHLYPHPPLLHLQPCAQFQSLRKPAARHLCTYRTLETHRPQAPATLPKCCGPSNWRRRAGTAHHFIIGVEIREYTVRNVSVAAAQCNTQAIFRRADRRLSCLHSQFNTDYTSILLHTCTCICVYTQWTEQCLTA